MLLADIGDPIWIPEGTFLLYEDYDWSRKGKKTGIPVGDFTKKPLRGIFLQRLTLKSDTYIKAFVDTYGQRLILESDIQDMKGNEENVS